MKICYLGNLASWHTVKVARYFVEKGDEVHIISFEQPNPLYTNEMEGITTHIIKTNKKFLFMTMPYKALQVSRILKKLKPDVLHAHYISKYGIIATLTGFKPMVISAWGSDMMVDTNGVLKYPILYALHKADVVHCHGENIRERALSLGIDPRKLRTMYFGIDVDRFKRDHDDQYYRDIKAKLGLAGRPIVISTRVLDPVYDVKTLIRAIPPVLAQVPDTMFLIFNVGREESKLKELARDLGVEHSVRFMGRVASEELPGYLGVADVYVSTSLSDGGISASTIEAMACKLPVIVTEIADNRKWVKDGVNGYIFHTGDSEALALKIVYLLNNKDVRADFGNNNRKLVQEQSNYYNEVKKIENIYIQIINIQANNIRGIT